MPQVLFDKEKHQYILNGKPIPSVSEILRLVGDIDYSKLPLELLERMEYAKELGVAVHKATELLDLGTLDEKSIDSSVEPYLDAYKQFKRKYKPSIECVEVQYSNNDADFPEYEYGCTIDRIMVIDGVRWVVDLKTGNKYRNYRLQTAAYKLAYNFNTEDVCMKRGCLYINDKGEFKLDEHKVIDDYEYFLSALRCFYFKKPRYKSKKVEIWD